MSEEQFSKHWLQVHGPLALDMPLREYVQAHRLPHPHVTETRYHGIVEVWLDSFEVAESLNMVALLTDEQVVHGDRVPEGNGVVKASLLVRRPAACPPVTLRASWLANDERALGEAVGAVRHVRSVALDAAYANGAEPVCDGIRELWFESLAAYERSRVESSDQWTRLLAPAGSNRAANTVFLSQERRLR